ncbi:OST-HTH associated domain protein, partial [Gregarina niphandrodes]
MVGWLEIRAQVNDQLVAEGVPSLTEQDAFLLYLMILLLYEEGVEPSKAEILFKLREHNASDALVQHAIAYYAATPQWYEVAQATDQIHCVYFRQQPKWFRGWVDLKSPRNHHPPQLWVDFLDFLLDRPGGWLFSHTRYVLAKALKKHGPLSLQRLRLGDIAHLIQLALQQEYLCYETTMIVPSWISPGFVADKRYALADHA